MLKSPYSSLPTVSYLLSYILCHFLSSSPSFPTKLLVSFFFIQKCIPLHFLFSDMHLFLLDSFSHSPSWYFILYMVVQFSIYFFWDVACTIFFLFHHYHLHIFSFLYPLTPSTLFTSFPIFLLFPPFLHCFYSNV